MCLGFAALYAALYLRGLDFGRPMCEHCDEWAIAEQSMTMTATGPLAPLREYSYGSLNIFIQCGVSALVHAYNNAFGVYRDAANHPIRKDLTRMAADPWDRDKFMFYLAARATVACYAGLAFGVLYLLAKRLFASRATAALCVLATMLNPLMVQHAHYALPNMLVTLLILATVYCCLVFFDGGSLRVLYAAALLAGLSVGAKLTGVVAFAPVAGCAVARLRRDSVRHLPFLFLLFVVAFLISEPYIFLDTRDYFTDLASEVHGYSSGGLVDSRDLHAAAFGSESVRRFAARFPLLNPLIYWFHQGIFWFLLSLAGCVLLPFVTGRRGMAVLIFPAAFYLFVGVQQKALSTNYATLLPFVALGLGAVWRGIAAWRDRQGRFSRRVVTTSVVALMAVALAAPARNAFGVTGQFMTKDTYQTALEWIESNIPRDAKIATESGLAGRFPFANEGRTIRSEDLLFFWRPYADFLNDDYVVVLTAGQYDRYPRFNPLVVFRDQGPGLLEELIRNRRINEQRLILVRHVTPEECGYVQYAEMPLTAHDIYIYKVPKVVPVRIAPRFPNLEGPSYWHLPAKGRVSARERLEAGRYDVFLCTTRKRAASSLVYLTLRIDGQPAVSVHVIEADRHQHFACTIDVPAQMNLTFEVTAANAASASNEEYLLLHEITCVPTTGEPIVEPAPAQTPRQ